MPSRFFVNRLQIGERGMASGAPVHHILAAINQTFFVKADKYFTNGARQPCIQRESLAAPVARGSQPDHLLFDGPAGFLFPLPNAAFKLLASDVVLCQTLLCELTLHNQLSRNARMI